MLRSVKRFIPEEAKRFVGADGKLQTTQQNLDFLVEHGLEVDNGRMIRISAGSELSRAATNYSVTVAYSPRHIIHPFDLRYFDPRGHPMAAMVRVKYAQKTQEEPLWIMVTAAGGSPAVVRSVTQRRFTRCLHDAFRELRSEPGPKRQVARRMQGTLWITFHNPIKAARHSPERFGRVIANGLVRYCTE
ncbi:hypothetical protein VFPPC_04798 [Pochonia chlamydosporia 170]|uniref:Uncharacterized protein n=1 Tax=Pochonia chlamydosporia 170 TaxID=1380566 RepID=A0A179FSK0_METCM|nr:hypothetical protein VFPPC_04798 [Pochonia chlamydosporia 170]OAQ68574.1 hypothetical protein VFPPC_04798 [Pochonia chlamydosporia 170]